MTNRNLRIVAAILAVLLVLGLCAWGVVALVAGGSDSEAHDGVDSGVVVERSRRVVVVQEDDGERDKHSIHKRSTKCQVGSRWPDCKR